MNTESNMRECPICFDELTEENQHKTPCNHIFHLSCVKKQIKSECALCRKPLYNINRPSNIPTYIDFIYIIERRISRLLDENNMLNDDLVSMLLNVLDKVNNKEFSRAIFLFDIYKLLAEGRIRNNISGSINNTSTSTSNNENSTVQCSALTKRYRRCLKQTKNNSGKCNIHNRSTTTSNSNTTIVEIPMVQCSGTTKKGKQCLHRIKNSSGKCHNHQ